MKIIREYFVLQYNDSEKFVEIDRTSGGYPALTDISHAERFKNYESALDYQKYFPNYTIKLVTTTHKIKKI